MKIRIGQLEILDVSLDDLDALVKRYGGLSASVPVSVPSQSEEEPFDPTPRTLPDRHVIRKICRDAAPNIGDTFEARDLFPDNAIRLKASQYIDGGRWPEFEGYRTEEGCIAARRIAPDDVPETRPVKQHRTLPDPHNIRKICWDLAPNRGDRFVMSDEFPDMSVRLKAWNEMANWAEFRRSSEALTEGGREQNVATRISGADTDASALSEDYREPATARNGEA